MHAAGVCETAGGIAGSQIFWTLAGSARSRCDVCGGPL